MGPQLFSCGDMPSISFGSLTNVSFNGATTFQLWRLRSVQMAPMYISYASMGPQLFSCGDLRSIVTDCYRIVSFNGATTFQLWRSFNDSYITDTIKMLQWGHNFSVVEMQHFLQLLHLLMRASMGPQLFSCGDASLFVLTAFAVVGFNGATTFQLWRSGRADERYHGRSSWLQWGHNFSVVEMALNTLTK